MGKSIDLDIERDNLYDDMLKASLDFMMNGEAGWRDVALQLALISNKVDQLAEKRGVREKPNVHL